MRRIIALIFVILFCFSVLTGCEQKEEVSRDVIDCRYTAAHDTIETDYDYKYDVWSDEFRLMPNTHTVHHDEEYEILYRVTYDDGTAADKWESVTRAEYRNAEKEINNELVD